MNRQNNDNKMYQTVGENSFSPDTFQAIKKSKRGSSFALAYDGKIEKPDERLFKKLPL